MHFLCYVCKSDIVVSSINTIICCKGCIAWFMLFIMRVCTVTVKQRSELLPCRKKVLDSILSYVRSLCAEVGAQQTQEVFPQYSSMYVW